MTPVKLSQWAGRSLIIIAALHTVVTGIHPFWITWFSGGLWTFSMEKASALTAFWALPGGFVVTMVLLGLLVIHLAKRGEVAPGYVGWALLGWSVVCVAIIGVSGFLTALVPAGMLITANIKARRRSAVG
ncbi:hypothetical protein FB566_2807 [Stackebrandtia endophytica]|uniref:DUF4064 domain-containing protein n=1 Tax=Stackebrandtia endophytica TaxID=1496996 RepID=A0A543AXH2_9ACTN|nr:DUF6463 family protein [Stackebrandtia endophytica]TQL77253.1 hypothetical protein FB566_2807 [Stackebrandtia endophytica]